MIKEIKDFMVYVVHSHIISYVPNDVVKDILTQKGPDGKRGNGLRSFLSMTWKSSQPSLSMDRD